MTNKGSLELSRWDPKVTGHAPNLSTHKMRFVAQAGLGELNAQVAEVNRLFRLSDEFGTPPPHVITVQDVTRGIVIDPVDQQNIQKLVIDTNASFNQKSQTVKLTHAIGRVISTLRHSYKHIDSDTRMELTRRAMAFWKRNYQTDYGKPPTVRYEKSMKHVLRKAGVQYISKKPNGRGGWDYVYKHPSTGVHHEIHTHVEGHEIDAVNKTSGVQHTGSRKTGEFHESTPKVMKQATHEEKQMAHHAVGDTHHSLKQMKKAFGYRGPGSGGGHKYVGKSPNGKGGWTYTYAHEGGEHHKLHVYRSGRETYAVNTHSGAVHRLKDGQAVHARHLEHNGKGGVQNRDKERVPHHSEDSMASHALRDFSHNTYEHAMHRSESFVLDLSKALRGERAGHKYKTRKPDGKGGWIYEYNTNVGGEYRESSGQRTAEESSKGGFLDKIFGPGSIAQRESEFYGDKREHMAAYAAAKQSVSDGSLAKHFDPHDEDQANGIMHAVLGAARAGDAKTIKALLPFTARGVKALESARRTLWNKPQTNRVWLGDQITRHHIAYALSREIVRADRQGQDWHAEIKQQMGSDPREQKKSQLDNSLEKAAGHKYLSRKRGPSGWVYHYGPEHEHGEGHEQLKVNTKKGPFQIRVRGETPEKDARQTVAGHVLGDFAMHREKGGTSYNVTHTPSGYNVRSAHSKPEAEALVHHMHEHATGKVGAEPSVKDLGPVLEAAHGFGWKNRVEAEARDKADKAEREQRKADIKAESVEANKTRANDYRLSPDEHDAAAFHHGHIERLMQEFNDNTNIAKLKHLHFNDNTMRNHRIEASQHEKQAEKKRNEAAIEASREAWGVKKSGEGSHGGHILGHTKAGKPIYAHKAYHVVRAGQIIETHPSKKEAHASGMAHRRAGRADTYVFSHEDYEKHHATKSQLVLDLSKAGHKYISKKPNGRGGYDYVYVHPTNGEHHEVSTSREKYEGKHAIRARNEYTDVTHYKYKNDPKSYVRPNEDGDDITKFEHEIGEHAIKNTLAHQHLPHAQTGYDRAESRLRTAESRVRDTRREEHIHRHKKDTEHPSYDPKAHHEAVRAHVNALQHETRVKKLVKLHRKRLNETFDSAHKSALIIDLMKGRARGGKYYKRVPTGNPKRPWRYYYTRAQYEREHGGENKHVSGSDTRREYALHKLAEQYKKDPSSVDMSPNKIRIWVDGKEFGLPKSTRAAHITKDDKTYTPQRQELHKNIISKFTEHVSRVPDNKQPVAIVMMGGGGAGKGTIKAAVLGDYKDFVNVDPDEVKDELPEYKAGLHLGQIDNKPVTAKNAAFMAHDESSDVAKKIRERAMADRKNVIIDGTGKDGVEYAGRLKALKEAGYHVRLIYAHADKDESIARAHDRAERGGRYVPDEVLEDAHSRIPGNFQYVAAHADDVVLMHSKIPPETIYTEPPPHAHDDEKWSYFKKLGSDFHKKLGVQLPEPPKRSEKLAASLGHAMRKADKPPALSLDETIARMKKNAAKYKDEDLKGPAVPWPVDGYEDEVKKLAFDKDEEPTEKSEGMLRPEYEGLAKARFIYTPPYRRAVRLEKK